ncbi:hypothetical protein JHL17_36040 [Azospirillum sp. YIM B02556]|uniref:Uncharacterized protein n=1 Tax=Azospirillum endophyticum TaxID=2800326 RepID=A0ABS1FHB7_9PROT|nr:hypothetical protein [Azospirillum endophyticum]MBK1842818.1 hypothetical protein [Azospirillum endophyticum]
MFKTRPITSHHLWELIEHWVVERMTPGVIWLPGGWTRWAMDDLHAYTLDHALLNSRPDSGSDASSLPVDLSREFPNLMGDDPPLGFTLNRHHKGEQTLFISLHTQSPHRSQDDLVDGVRATLSRLKHSRHHHDDGDEVFGLVALVLRHDLRERLVRELDFKHHFSVQVKGYGNGDAPTVHALSHRVSRHHHRPSETAADDADLQDEQLAIPQREHGRRGRGRPVNPFLTSGDESQSAFFYDPPESDRPPTPVRSPAYPPVYSLFHDNSGSVD